MLPNVLQKQCLDYSSRYPKVLALPNVLWKYDLDYGGQNPHYTKSLIYTMKTPMAEYELYGGDRTPTVGFDLKDKVEGDL